MSTQFIEPIDEEEKLRRRRESQRKWREAHREQKLESDARYREENRERLQSQEMRDYMREHNRKYYADHREERIAYSRAYREANAESVRESQKAYRIANPEKRKAAQKAWKEAHPEQVRAHNRNYQARKSGAEGSHSSADIESQLARQNNRCFWCGCGLADEYHVDHVMPLSLGGTNWPSNLVVSCPTCNLKKKDKHPADFAGVMF